MRLTRHTDYALRLLMALALEPDVTQKLGDVADRYQISTDHLRKVAQTLVSAGFVHSVRGRNGGVTLARPAAQIGLGAVVRATEEDFALVECLQARPGPCAIARSCALPGPLEAATAAFLSELDRHTLADLTASPQRAARMRNSLRLRGNTDLKKV
jgi:Rrf2 family nitric oxide-sensitive transcriptional repressor